MFACPVFCIWFYFFISFISVQSKLNPITHVIFSGPLKDLTLCPTVVFQCLLQAKFSYIFWYDPLLPWCSEEGGHQRCTSTKRQMVGHRCKGAGSRYGSTSVIEYSTTDAATKCTVASIWAQQHRCSREQQHYTCHSTAALAHTTDARQQNTMV